MKTNPETSAPAPTGATITAPSADATSAKTPAPQKGFKCGGCGAPARRPFTYACPHCPDKEQFHSPVLWQEITPGGYRRKALPHA